ncbi:MAG: hypothetical protein R2850_05750 [Bacteroidia bacterium]
MQNLKHFCGSSIHVHLINENKWRAGRYGIDGKMIDFGKEEEVRTRSLILELLNLLMML